MGAAALHLDSDHVGAKQPEKRPPPCDGGRNGEDVG
jgi:hypothetical protein